MIVIHSEIVFSHLFQSIQKNQKTANFLAKTKIEKIPKTWLKNFRQNSTNFHEISQNFSQAPGAAALNSLIMAVFGTKIVLFLLTFVSAVPNLEDAEALGLTDSWGEELKIKFND